MKQRKVSYFLGALAVIGVLYLNFLQDAFFVLENKSYDVRLKLRGVKKNSGIKDIIIVSIDEDSLDHLGRWPWDRSIHAKLVDILTKDGAKVILFDILFLERSNPNSDNKLILATQKSGRVINETLFEFEGTSVIKQKAPLPGLVKHSLMLGAPNVFPELDGVLRRVKPTFFYENKFYPHVSLAVASAYLNKPWEEMLGNIPVNDLGEMIVNYCGPFGTFEYKPYYKILAGDFEKKYFRDKIVLVGYAAAGLGDRHVTPLSHITPGIETIANNIYTIVHSDYIYYSKWYVRLFSILIVGIAMLFFLPRLNALKSTLFAASLLIIWTGAAYYFFVTRQVWVEYVPTTTLIIVSYISITSWRFVTEEKEKRWLKKAFGQYLSPAVINEIIKNPQALSLGGKRQELTVLFSDIRGFTTISEASTPENVVSLLNEYLTKMTEVVFRQEGTLDKFIGDAVMAFWNAPIPQSDHAKKAVFCAIEMMEELEKLKKKWTSEGKVVIDIGIGVNTGEMVVGNLGSVERMDYTVIGDNVNLASRLEGLNKEYKTHIIISEFTYNYVKDFVVARSLGAAKVKGKAKAVEIYAVEGRK
ncbi:MAG: Adenylate cyclase 1 [Elusimicrobia bacterium ADurb.Bin231]|nr:MAG: Adenylate cyclase 1 [Elusimicrobia bacterium ADurb.Bin231]